jgi:3-hydroxyisobutyrate dehydrogenase
MEVISMNVVMFGTGLMGGPMSKKLLDAGYKLSVYNRTKSKAEGIGKLGAKVYGNSIEAIKDHDVLVTMLSEYNAVCNVLFPEDEINFSGKTVIQMSTIAPDESLLIKERVEKNGGKYLEAPVLGSIPQVEAGKLIVLVGGTKEQFEEYQKLFSSFSDNIQLIGEAGKASAIKLALNQLIASLAATFSMSLGYLQEKDVNLDKFMEILKGSPLYAPTFEKKMGNMMNRDFSNPHFPVKHMLKDVNLVLNELDKNNINSAPLKGVQEILKKTIENKMSELDYSALYNTIHPK